MKLAYFADVESDSIKAKRLLEINYGFEFHCLYMDKSLRFAHNGKGCTIVAAMIGKDVVIYQNVTIGSNMKYNKDSHLWENVGSPIIGDNRSVAAGAIITRDIPPDTLAYGVNQFRQKESKYDLIFNENMIASEVIEKVNQERVKDYLKNR